MTYWGKKDRAWGIIGRQGAKHQVATLLMKIVTCCQINDFQVKRHRYILFGIVTRVLNIVASPIKVLFANKEMGVGARFERQVYF